MNRQIREVLFAVIVAAMLSICSCQRSVVTLHVEQEPSPIATTSLVPQATRLSAGGLVVSWQRPLPTGGYVFEMALGDGVRWSPVRTIASGNLSMFTADLPAVAELSNGNLFAYWELKEATEDDPYATTIQTAISTDEGKTWGHPIAPYSEKLAGQHSFIASFPDHDGIGLLWLDAAEQSKLRVAAHGTGHATSPEMGSIGLRYATLNNHGDVSRGSFVDPITCECCPTSAALTDRGPVVAYRGRQEANGAKPSEVDPSRPTVRDIYVSRLDGDHWTKPRPVHADNWIINACPDNGPSVDAHGNRLVVAWWTESADQPKVQVAFSEDAGDTFTQPIRVDAGKGEGQVTAVLLPDHKSAIVGWLEGGTTWARFIRETGETSAAVSLGPTPRHSRLPRWVVNGDHHVTAVWTRKDHDAPSVAVSRIAF
ncbi:MAG TPA: sialidase family protein [Candidatus Sulfotelmatobacter sp.]|nr:sialidase family protein [Candidatus Sulfotelmatobacter sp.]